MVERVAPAAPGLRTRKRAAVMRRIQTVAVDLFDANGFEKVTIDQIADAAQVSPSSVYRYFGTKEGIIVHDEYDEQLFTTALQHLADHDLVPALRCAFAEVGDAHFVVDAELTARRMPYLFTVPSVRAAAHLAVEEVAQRLAEVLAQPGRSPLRSPVAARAVASAGLWALFGAVIAWYESGAEGSVMDAVQDGLDAIAIADLD